MMLTRTATRRLVLKPMRLQTLSRRVATLRDSHNDPDKQLINGTYGGRILAPEHERSFPHTNVLENLERPDKNLDFLPTQSPSRIRKQADTLFGSAEDAEAAIKLLEEVEAVTGWDNIDPELEARVTRLAELKEGDSVAILGAGISGLTLAWVLGRARPDLTIKVLESKLTVGGWMNSEVPTTLPAGSEMTEKDALLEWGPRTLQASHSGTHLIRLILTEMGLFDKLAYVSKSSPANRKGILFEGKPYQLPASNGQVLKFLRSKISSGLKLSPFKDIIACARPLDVRDESVGSYITRRFGAVAAQRFVSAIMRGIYAGDVDELSARSVARIGRIYALEHDSPSMLATMVNGSGTRADNYAAVANSLLLQAILRMPFEEVDREMKKYSVAVFDQGIQWLPKTIESKLADLPNVHLLKKNDVQSVELDPTDSNKVVVKVHETLIDTVKDVKADLVVSTVPGFKASSFLKKQAPELSESIGRSFKYTTLAVVNVTIPHKFVGENWFGYLVPKTEKNPEDLLGVIFNTAVRQAASPVKRIPLPNPFDTVKLEQKTTNPGESLLEYHDAEKFANEHLRRSLLTDLLHSPQVTPMPEFSNLTLMLGGHLWDGRAELPSESELKERTVAVLNKHLNANLGEDDLDKIDIQVKIHQNCIPQYTVGHKERLQAIKDQTSKAFGNRLFLSGTAFGRGVGIGDCVVDSFSVAARYSKERKLVFPGVYLNSWLATSFPSLFK